MEQLTNLPGKAAVHRAIKKESRYGVTFAIIPLVGYVLFHLIPIAIAFITMFVDMDGFKLGTMQWNGFANFKAVFTDARFFKSLGISVYLTLAHIIGLVTALAVSAVLSQKLRGAKAFTALFFIPYVCSTVAVSVMWQWMFDGNYGIINSVLKFLGSENGINWFGSTKAYTPMLVIVMAWQAPGYGIVMYTAALTGVNPSLYEAARIDGAGEFRLFWNIMLPLSKPVIASIGLFTMVFHWNSWFDVMIYIDQSHSALWTLQYYIMINYNNLSQIDSTKLPNLATDGVSQQAVRMALTIVGLVPILCIYPFFQKFLKDGVYTGAVKG